MHKEWSTRSYLVSSLGMTLACGIPCLGQEKGMPDVEALMNVKVAIATRHTQSQEEAPSIVSVVTRADIERYGWRELGDILRALPGFDFGNDGTALIGLSERGIWAHEGKALVMVDGITVSPLHNGNINYYGSYPSEMIERVEVIRGPGSAVYGQFAGTCVINIITRGVNDPEGGRFTLRGTTLGGGDQGLGGYLVASGHLSEGVSLSLNAGSQTSPFSRQPYTDTFFTGSTFDQDRGNTRRDTTYFVGTVKALGTEVHLLRHDFREAQVDGSDGTGNGNPVVPGLPPGTLGTVGRVIEGVRILHSFNLGESWALDATGEELRNSGGSVYPEEKFSHNGVNASGTERSRFTGDLALRWTPSFPATLLLGGGYIQNWERSVDLSNNGAIHDPSDPASGRLVPQATTQSRYGYLQYTQQIENAFGLTAGGRYQDSDTSHAFAPRLGLTYVTGDFNAKLLYGEAFREATLFQTYSTFFEFKGYIQPELIRSLELELGWRFSPLISGRLNLYRMGVTRSISFGMDDTGIYYLNAGSTHSKGIEASLEARTWFWGGFANLSYCEPDGHVDPFFLSSDGKSFLGVSPLKINAGAYVRFGPVQISPSVLYVSSRQGQTAASANSGFTAQVLPVLIESAPYPARLLANLALTWKDPYGKDTEVRLAATNLGNTYYPILQPYYGAHAPLPANDRRLTLDLVWRF